uniref:Uncharacterized protein n=1 Tax=Serinus canaria TaxID=9135 RepID=A0A8C9NQ09_SERCA
VNRHLETLSANAEAFETYRNGRVGVMEVDHAESRAPSLLVDFTRDLCGTGDIKHKPQQAENEGKEEEDLVPPHLIFMLWQASVLKRLMQWDHLEEAVRDVRSLLPCLPDVLVLVMIRPDSQEQLDQAVRALRRMQCVLDGALQLTVETAIYSPGQPGGVLEAKRAACRALREALNCHEGNWQLAKVTLAVYTFELFIPSQYLLHAMDWNFPMQVSGLGTMAFIQCWLVEICVISASPKALTKAHTYPWKHKCFDRM